jgi:hypothetical protein
LTSTSTSSTSTFNVVPLVSTFSGMQLRYNLTSGTQQSNLTESYTRVYASATTYKVTVTSSIGSQVTPPETAWILKNGTVLAINVAGQNLTGPTAQTMIVGLFAGFSAEVQAGSQLSTYTASQYFHTTGTSSVTIGSSTFAVTNYAANTLPQTITSCPPGTTTTLTNYKLSVGTPNGTSYKVVTYMQIAGSSTSNGQTSNFNYVIQIVSLTVG